MVRSHTLHHIPEPPAGNALGPAPVAKVMRVLMMMERVKLSVLFVSPPPIVFSAVLTIVLTSATTITTATTTVMTNTAITTAIITVIRCPSFPALCLKAVLTVLKDQVPQRCREERASHL